MSNKCVTVLAPNGRRQNVKVTPNTTILQVLEEVCKKQGFKAEEYDITHHNKVVDATAPLRFTGLPNNAQLEMAAATRLRFESNVKVGLTLENGERVVGEFEPAESLWGIVTALCPNEAESEDIPAVVYMGQEVTGKENLEGTTLRTLGLTRGGVVLRFFKRSPGQVLQQANVSAPLRKLPPADSSLPKKKHVSVMQPATEAVIQPQASETSVEPMQVELKPAEGTPTEPMLAESKAELPPAKPVAAVQPLEKEKSGKETKMNVESESEETVEVKSNPDISKSESTSVMDYEDSSIASTSAGTAGSNTPVKSESLCNQRRDEEENIIFLGERNAVVFDLSNVSGTAEDVPDDFFDLTLDDARQLLRDHKRRQAELEGAPLLTSQQRELEKSKLVLNHLNQYRRCIVRIQFPDRLVLQGMFSPLDSFNAVMDFVRNFLQYPEAEFHLFITPPKTILPPEQTLVGAGCVPCTLVHFGYSSGSYDKFLRDDVVVQITSLRGAAIAARQSRGLAGRPTPVLSSAGVAELIGTTSTSAANSRPAQTSSESGTVSSSSASAVKRTPTDKVPKWFKPGK